MHLSFITASDVIHDLLQVQPDDLAGVVDVGGLEVLLGCVHIKFKAKRLLYLIFHALASICAYMT